MAEAGPRDPCELFASAIAFIKQEIAEKEGRIQILQGQIGELSSSLRNLEFQLETDRAQLNAFEEEFSASCGGS